MNLIIKIITSGGILAGLSYIVYRELMERRDIYGLVTVIFVYFAFVIFLYKLINGLKPINVKKLKNILFILLIVNIGANIFLYIKTSYTPLADENRDWEIDTTEEWFLPKTSGEIDIPIGYWGIFSDSVLYNLLIDRNVIVQDILQNDFRVSFAEDFGDYKKMAGISKEDAKQYREIYVPQEIIFASGQTEEKKLYLVTGTVWADEDCNLYIILDEDNNVWIIPERLLASAYRTETEFKYEYRQDMSDIEKITFNYRYDMVMEELIANGKNNSLSNILYVSLLGVFGFIILLPLARRITNDVIIYLSVPMGVILEIVSCIIIGCVFGIKINKFLLIMVNIVLIFVVWGIVLSKKRMVKFTFRNSNSFDTSVAVGIIVFSIFCSSIWHKVFLSYDSLRNISLAQKIVENGNFREYFSVVSNYSLFFPVVNIGARLFNVQILYSLLPVLVCSFLGLLWTILRSHLDDMPEKYKYIVLICCFMSVVTVPMFQLNVIWILNNLGIGLYYTGAVILLLEGKRSNNKYYKYIALPLFILANTVRVEGPIFGILFLLMWDEIDEEAKKYSIVLGIVTTIVFLLNFFFNRQGKVFWSISKGSLVLAAVWSTVFYFYVVKKWKIWLNYLQKIDIGMLLQGILLIGIVGVAAFWKREIAIANIQALVSSLLTTGIYGVIWVTYLFTYIFDLLIKNEKLQEILVMRRIINTYFLTIFALMLFRDNPLHANYTDSGCRMMLHIIPLLIIYFVYYFKQFYIKEKSRMDGEEWKGERL